LNGARLHALPEAPGAYLWYYADAVSGDTTAVFIFMLGSPFSARYAARASRGARPLQHSAVNFALYRGGIRRQWVLSEYSHAEADAAELRIGDSRLRYAADGTVEILVCARTAPFGGFTKASLSLRPESPGLLAVPLVPGLTHTWEPVHLRAHATLRLPLLGEVLEGVGYHDINAGASPLGTDLARWTWARTHEPEATRVQFWLPNGEHVVVEGTAASAGLVRRPATAVPLTRTGWGLQVPRALEVGTDRFGAPRLLESSPFYARLEAKTPGGHTLAEVADFRRFRSPLIRWMAHFRTRLERAA
jgi:carotenoid 1,2-hydratase